MDVYIGFVEGLERQGKVVNQQINIVLARDTKIFCLDIREKIMIIMYFKIILQINKYFSTDCPHITVFNTAFSTFIDLFYVFYIK